MQNHPDHPQEITYLQQVLAHLATEIPLLDEQREAHDARVAYALAHMNVDNPESYSELTVSLSLLDGWKTLLRQMRYAQAKPYFARVDFADASYYIGKMTLLRGLDVLITDWRAPLATLYYEGRLGTASYDCPDGHIEGELTLKRQYQIENGTLLGFTDIDVTASDTFLQAALGASKDRRLRDIVTTIQAEQNRIIRAPLRDPLIVQGAAGSGKTTIALHRIAYLLYNHADTLKPAQVMILAPSQYFLSYISDVLPELGVEQVTQTTFADYVADVLELDTKKTLIASPLAALTEALNANLSATPRMAAAGLKGSLRFHELICRYLRHIEEALLPEEDFAVQDLTLFSRAKIAALFTETYIFLPTNKRAPEIEKFLTQTLNRQLPRIEARIMATFDKHMAKIRALMPEDTPARRRRFTAVIEKRDDMLRQLLEKAKPTRKKYMRTFRLKSAHTYYTALFTTSGLFEQLADGIFTPDEIRILATESRLALAKKSLEPEDLPPLLFMQKHLFGMKTEMKHVVIDEAQDYSPFQFLALREALPTASFSIMGDLHQGMLAHKGITNWSQVATGWDAHIQTLTQSYRTTIEIMDAANPVIMRLYEEGHDPGTTVKPAVPLAVPVIRHGAPVIRHNEKTTPEEAAKTIHAEITAAQEAGCQSIALIAKNEADCLTLQSALSSIANKLPIVTETAADYEGGILILPVYLAKGLEFDAVIITNASTYTSTPLDTKLLYIAMTRALHRLIIFD
ncbi:MAG: AAA family ATPase [Defluviitaleaceae bacterium]|nr:AAA family ATPase [Defluviitaleaceae bacterium]